MSKVVVIGGGVAGLATATLLAADGHEVDLFERNDDCGGRAGSWRAAGYRFDTGPSWWLMPEVFDHYFALLGTSTAARLNLTRLDPGYRVFFEGYRNPVDIGADAGTNEAIFEALETGAGKRLSDYLASGRETYTMAVDRFLYSNFDSPASFVGRDVRAALPALVRLTTATLEQFIAARFTDRRLRQILGYPAVFLGTSPDRTPALYHLMSGLDLADGVRYPMGGFARFIEVLVELAREQGVSLHTATSVTAIQTDDTQTGLRGLGLRGLGGRARRARVRGVTVVDRDAKHRFVPADIVVGANDLHHLETQLLPPRLRTYGHKWWDRRTSGPGAVLVCLGVRGELPQLAHHSLFFTADWKSNFDAIFGSPEHIPRPASVYVCRPSATDPTVAPPSGENLFILVPVPADVGLGRGGVAGAGDTTIEETADQAIAMVAAWAGIDDLADRIVVRRTVGPGDFAADFHAWRGGALGPAHTLRQSAFFRADNRSRRVAGLYYAGSSTRPGIGVPMCLISAELVLKRLRADRSAGPLRR